MSKKALTKEQIVHNRLSMELSGFLQEFKCDSLTEESIYSYFMNILLAANVDSDIIIDVFEDKMFGEMGLDYARGIKVMEGR